MNSENGTNKNRNKEYRHDILVSPWNLSSLKRANLTIYLNLYSAKYFKHTRHSYHRSSESRHRFFYWKSLSWWSSKISTNQNVFFIIGMLSQSWNAVATSDSWLVVSWQAYHSFFSRASNIELKKNISNHQTRDSLMA